MPKKRKTSARKTTRRSLTWQESIQKVLKDEGAPMHYVDIARKIGELGLKKLGVNAAPAVGAFLSASLNNEGEESPYVKEGRGIYALKASVPLAAKGDKDEEPAGLVKAFGLHWDREKVRWKTTTPEIQGVSLSGMTKVNFYNQKGVYILYNPVFKPVYVGQSTSTIGKRLKDHTNDRLKGRWRYFSWFGFLQVNEKTGNLELDADADGGVDSFSDMLEAVLIESMEPPLNKQRGQGVEGAEFLQVTSSEHKEEAKKMLNEMIKGM